MNIGIDISPLTSPHRTGVGEYTFELLDSLFRIDQTNQYFLFYNAFKDVKKFVPAWSQKNIHFISTRFPNKLFHASIQFFGWPKLDSLIERRAGVSLDYFFSSNIGFQSLSKKCKHILTVHDLSFEFFPQCFSPKRRLWHTVLSPKGQCQRADKILVPSENTKRDIQEIYDVSPEKIQVLSPGLSPIFFDSPTEEHFRAVKEKYQLPDKYILFLGTIEPRKNIEGVIAGFELSHLKNQGYDLLIAGMKGWKYTNIMKNIEQSTQVRYIGYVDLEDKPALYRGASVFVYPSLYEGFGFPVLEAMAVGCPVITSNRSSLPEIAADGAYYVNPYNISEISEGLTQMIANKKLSTFFIEKGYEQVKKFQWQKAAEQFLDLL